MWVQLLLILQFAVIAAAAAAAETTSVMALHVAVKKDAALIENLIKSGVDVNGRDELDNTPLHLAAWKNNVEVAKALLAAGADVTARAKFSNDPPTVQSYATPLHEAAMFDSVDVVRLLLANPKNDVEAKGRYGTTPLQYAVLNRKMRTLKALVEEGHANVNAKANYEDDGPGSAPTQTPLMRALSKHYMDIADYLVAKGAELNSVDKNGWSALHYEARDQNLTMIEKLVDNGADVKVDLTSVVKPANKQNILHFAIVFGVSGDVVYAIVDVLCNRGANDAALINAPDRDGWTPLHFAVDKGFARVAQLLLRNGASARVRAVNDGRTPAEMAKQRSNYDLAKLLEAAN